ncbi:MAG: sialidase family protein, partial [Thermoanaerobaculia bacterium]
VDESVCDCCATAAVAVAGGSAVAYRDRTVGEIRDVQVALRPVAGAVVTRPVGHDRWKIAGCPVNGPALAANAGQLAVAWFAAPGDLPRMAVARSTDGGVTWSQPQPLAAAKPLGQLAIAPLAGGFALSWLEAIAGGTELRLTRLDASGKLEPSLAIARTGAGRSGGIPRLASAGKRLALVWLDGAAGRLCFATLRLDP